MNVWFFILGSLYLGSLVYATIGARKNNKSDEDFAMGGSDLGIVLGCLTVAATLFSTFTLMGMPDFFRQHGIGAWIFLAVSDAVFAFVILWFGFYLRRKAFEKGFEGVAGLMRDCYGTKQAGFLYLIGVFIFLVPYVAVQIRGISIFLSATFPDLLPIWGWAALMVMVMLAYSEAGGLKAIVYADAIQGVILLTVTIIVAVSCVQYFGGVPEMFQKVAKVDEALLSVPGPQGLFTTQFLVASMIVIVMVPVTQPQVTVRLVIMKDLTSMKRMSVMLGIFAVVLLLSIIPIGMYGAARYSDLSTTDFLAQVLIHDQLPFIAATVAIGLIAASISTADSQIFAFGNECRSMLSDDNNQAMKRMRYIIVAFALTSLGVAIISNDQLVLLARVSFAGTSLLGPLVIAAVLVSQPLGKEIIYSSAIGLIVFLLSLFAVVPDTVMGVRMDLFLFCALSLISTLSVMYRKYTPLRAS